MLKRPKADGRLTTQLPSFVSGDAGSKKLTVEPVTGMHIKGQLTLGENIGDLGGLEVA